MHKQHTQKKHEKRINEKEIRIILFDVEFIFDTTAPIYFYVFMWFCSTESFEILLWAGIKVIKFK